VRFTGWDQTEPYRMARVESLPDSESGDADLDAQVTHLHALCSRFKEQGIELPVQFEGYLNQITDIGVLTDLVASTLVADPMIRQSLLEETSIPRRLEKLLAGLKLQLS
jgi:Lon protease-like protein